MNTWESLRERAGERAAGTADDLSGAGRGCPATRNYHTTAD